MIGSRLLNSSPISVKSACEFGHEKSLVQIKSESKLNPTIVFYQEFIDKASRR